MSDQPLALMKQHIVVEDNFDDDDALIQGYIDAAEALVVRYVRADLSALHPTGWPEDIRQAVRMIVALFYDNRQASEDFETGMPMPAKVLLADHRSFD